ncbi:unnamed protein product [Rotaria sordida]|uniref:Uncharacterized protein n=2 Tax=Rotaria sordida TaxID=392033 RepID=A0A819VIP4_9BILA|nr:unnamed protein product [Rotaria sordida]
MIREIKNETIKHQISLIFALSTIYPLLNLNGHVTQPTGLVSVLANPLESTFQNQLDVWLEPFPVEEKHLFTLFL